MNVQVTDRVAGNNIYIPLNDQNEGAPNFVTDSDVDKDTNTPAYKDNYAKLEVITKKANHLYLNIIRGLVIDSHRLV